MRLLNSEDLEHPDNPSPPLYAVLSVPDDESLQILVMPFLRRFDSPPFETIGEVMEFCRQALYGLRFLHNNNIAHRFSTQFYRVQTRCSYTSYRDPHSQNIMLDPLNMYPKGFYTGFAPFADHNAAFTFEHPDTPGSLKIPYIRGGDRDIPETLTKQQYADPFASDVWWVGNLIKRELIDVSAICLIFSYNSVSVAVFWTRFLKPPYRKHVPREARRPTYDDSSYGTIR